MKETLQTSEEHNKNADTTAEPKETSLTSQKETPQTSKEQKENADTTEEPKVNTSEQEECDSITTQSDSQTRPSVPNEQKDYDATGPQDGHGGSKFNITSSAQCSNYRNN